MSCFQEKKTTKKPKTKGISGHSECLLQALSNQGCEQGTHTHIQPSVAASESHCQAACALVEKQSPAEAVTTPCPEPAEAASRSVTPAAIRASQEASRKRTLKSPGNGAGLCSGTPEQPQQRCPKAHTVEEDWPGIKVYGVLPVWV